MTGLTRRLTRNLPLPLPRGVIAGALAALLLGGPAAAEMRTWELDPAHTTIAFLVKHVGYANTLGVFREVTGEFSYDPETRQLGDVRVTVPAASVWTNNERRDEHVRAGDFLDAANHPQIVFSASGGTATAEDTGTVTGELTLLGMTLPLELEVTLNKRAPYPFGHGRETIGVSARGTVMRSAYGMTYAIPGEIVGDAVQVLIEFEALAAE